MLRGQDSNLRVPRSKRGYGKTITVPRTENGSGDSNPVQQRGRLPLYPVSYYRMSINLVETGVSAMHAAI